MLYYNFIVLNSEGINIFVCYFIYNKYGNIFDTNPGNRKRTSLHCR